MTTTTAAAAALVKNHAEMMQACASGEHDKVLALLDAANKNNNDDATLTITTSITNTNNNITQKHLLAAQQDPTTGISPLMLASKHGHVDICTTLLEAGAPWNAVDRYGKCAGDYATENCFWDVVNLLVEAGTKAELILGASIRLARQLEQGGSTTSNNAGSTNSKLLSKNEAKADSKNNNSKVLAAPSNNDDSANDSKQNANNDNNDKNNVKQQPDTASPITTVKDKKDEENAIPISHEPCTKPDYLQHNNVRYNAANTLLLDNDDDAVMMEWERPLMNAHANIITHNGSRGKRVLNIGFGLGIIDTALQSYEPSLHVIIEAHPVVYDKMIQDGWDKKENVRICFGRWQDELPKLIDEIQSDNGGGEGQEGHLEFDGIFYDTYGEHFTDLEDFHELMSKVLHKPDGIYSFFNGLAPDNLFFHGVACNCVKIQLEHLGLDTEFAQCEIQVDEKDWEGVRRKYWHGRNTYYLPIVTWKKQKKKEQGGLGELIA